MKGTRVRLDRGLAGLSALGVESEEVLLDPDGRPSSRAEALPGDPRPASSDPSGRVRLRFPLPGTPDESGRRRESPRGAGTGWVVLERWNAAPLRPLLRSRLTAPRSASLAERAWNLLCHLRASGVGTPEPLAVGALGNGLVSRDSFLVTRDVEGFVPLPAWLERVRAPRARRRGLVALGRMLSNLFRSGVHLPRIEAADVAIYEDAELDDTVACGVPDPTRGPRGERLRRNRLPGVVITDVSDGRVRPALSDDEIAATLARILATGPGPPPRVGARPSSTSPSEARRVGLLATRGLERARRKSILAAVLPRP